MVHFAIKFADVVESLVMLAVVAQVSIALNRSRHGILAGIAQFMRLIKFRRHPSDVAFAETETSFLWIDQNESSLELTSK